MLNIDDRVRANTPSEVNDKIDNTLKEHIRYYSTQTRECLALRIQELDQEWDIERILMMNASTLAFTGLALGLTRSRRWFAVPAVILPFLFLHAVQGWCPPLGILRRMGVRTRGEIDCEKFAIKALRGDFETLTPLGAAEADKMPRAEEALEALCQ